MDRFKLNTIIWFLTAVITVYAAGASFVIREITQTTEQIGEAWTSFNSARSQRSVAVYNLSKDLGYGGLVHKYKNLILRKDVKLARSVYEKLGAIQSHLDLYRDLGLSAEESVAVGKIERTMAAYRRAMDQIERLARREAEAATIWSVSTIDDAPAFEGLAVLTRLARQEAEAASASNSKSRSISAIRSAVGYGGAIHSFKDYVLTGNPKSRGDFERAAEKLNAAIDVYRGMTAEAGELDALNTVRRTFDGYGRRLGIVEDARANGEQIEQIDSLVALDDTPALTALDRLDEIIAAELAVEAAGLYEGLATSQSMSRLLLIAMLIAASVIVLTTRSILARRMLRPIETLKATMNDLAAGRMQVAIPFRDRSDEIGEMANATAVFQQNACKLDRDAEIKDVVSAVSYELRKSDSIEEFGKTLAAQISQALGAHCAAFYHVDETGDGYELAGAYGVAPDALGAHSFRAEEGLVGRCAAEKRLIVAQGATAEGLEFVTGFGEIAPRGLLAAPLSRRNRALGVVELASINAFSEAQQTLLTELCEAAAIDLETLRASHETTRLLAQSKVARAELEGSLVEFQTLFDRSLSEIYIFDRETLKFVSANDVAKRNIGYEMEELEGLSPLDLKPEFDVRAFHEMIAPLLSGERRSVEYVAAHQRKDGSRYAAEVRLQITTFRKRPVFMALVQDVTERQHSEQRLQAYLEELEEAKEAAETASRMKSEFVANMSHELRTPLNSLLILAEDLAENDDGNLSDDQVEAATLIHDGGSDLLGLINGILDLAKVEAGKMSVSPEEVRLPEICGRLRAMFDPVAEKQGLDFKIDCADQAPQSLLTDNACLQQILRNLLANAFKFTHDGGVQLRIYRPAPDTRLSSERLCADAVVAFAVSDSGIGIPAEKLEAIFESFQQADGSTSRRYGGTGLGLSISREFSQLIGGELQVESMPGDGSTFTLFVPETPGRAAIDGHARSAFAAPARLTETPRTGPGDDRENIGADDTVVLVIEDDEKFARVLSSRAREHGAKCIIANTGQSGVEAAKAYRPDLIMLDVVLPDSHQLDALAALKTDPDTREAPLYVISAYDDTVKAVERGAVAYLTKPVTRAQINAILDGLDMGRTAEEGILVVEDDDALRERVARILEARGADVVAVASAERAYAALEQRTFECMILDMRLPGMSGLELLEKLRENGAQTPRVIGYSGMELSPQERERVNRYTDHYIRKNGADISAALSSLATASDTDDAAESDEATAPVEPSKPTAAERALDIEISALKDLKVLIVDDDMRNTFALAKLLGKQGVNVVMAENGAVALEKLEAERDVQMVLMDIMMPVMNGYDAISEIRRRDGVSHLPIVAVTANAMDGDGDKCMQVGADAYVTKPIDKKALLPVMSRLVEEGRT